MLTIEDGTLVANADSYVTVEEARTFALRRGITLSAVDADVEVLLIGAMDYLEDKRSMYKGEKVDPTQSLCWPRQDVIVDGALIDITTIPQTLKNAQCQLAIEKFNGTDIQPTRASAFVTHEKVGAIESRYSEKVSTAQTPSMPKVDNWLETLLAQGSALLTTVRI